VSIRITCLVRFFDRSSIKRLMVSAMRGHQQRSWWSVLLESRSYSISYSGYCHPQIFQREETGRFCHVEVCCTVWIDDTSRWFPELMQICGRNERISSRSERKQASEKVCTMTVVNDHAESRVLWFQNTDVSCPKASPIFTSCYKCLKRTTKPTHTAGNRP